MKTSLTLACALSLILVAARADAIDLVGGQTSVLLDTATLSSAASLNLSSVSPEVIAPGELTAASVAFAINSPDAAMAPTTFTFEPGLASFSGTIEHTGSVLFNSDMVEVGDFSIGFDAGRVGDDRSGFFVESTVGIPAILFDVATPSTLSATSTELVIGADLLVSSEFAGFLLSNSLATADLTGADVGDALVSGIAIPEPAAASLLAIIALAIPFRRR